MAYISDLAAIVGQPTRASLYNNAVNNIDWLQGLCDAEHNFNKTSGNGGHKTITATSITTTGVAVIGGKTTVAGTYDKPLLIGGAGGVRVWWDATNTVIRVKATDPASATDGNIILEASTS